MWSHRESASGFASPRLRFVFLTLNNYTLTPLSSAMDVLRLANRVSGYEAYEWCIASLDGQVATASNGMRMEPTFAIQQVETTDVVFVCGGTDIEQLLTPALIMALRALSHRCMAMGALCTGVYALAKAGLLNGYKAAAHWEYRSTLTELFPKVTFCNQVYTIDRDRYTCPGGLSTVDLMLHIVKAHQGEEIALQVSEQMVLGRIRNTQDRQNIPLQARAGQYSDILIEAVSLMESNIEEPIPLDEIAQLSGVSKRQIERLFKRYIGEVPSTYYTNLRLRKARNLLLESRLSVTEVALACGFLSSPYFSKCYRELFGHTPSTERRSAMDQSLAVNSGTAANRSASRP